MNRAATCQLSGSAMRCTNREVHKETVDSYRCKAAEAIESCHHRQQEWGGWQNFTGFMEVKLCYMATRLMILRP